MTANFSYLTPKDDEAIRNFVGSYAGANVFLKPDGPLFHYTTGENLIRIIESQELWSTQASCLNDMSELLYAATKLREKVIARFAASRDPNITPFLKHLDLFLLSQSHSLVARSAIFVSCLSESRDDLSQWRAYSGGEGGYAIQLDSAKLLLDEKDPEVRLVRVEYNTDRHDSMFDDALGWGERSFMELEGASRAEDKKAWADEFVQCYVWSLGYLAACLKHPKFAGEKEWRLIYVLRPDGVERMQFRQRQSMMSRHVPLRLAKPLPITGVVVGPCRHPELSSVAVNDLLSKKGYDLAAVKVHITDVPYRAA
jgi:Protein of unknown function (DUF2971)